MEIGEETKPLPSSPSLQAMESGHLQEEKTNTPLWRSKQEDRDNGESQPLLGAPDVEVIGRVRQDRGPNTFRTGLNKHSRGRWRSLILVAVLWITEFFISAAYSMIGPFFPEEVSIQAFHGTYIIICQKSIINYTFITIIIISLNKRLP